jgi:hypothetical protein
LAILSHSSRRGFWFTGSKSSRQHRIAPARADGPAIVLGTPQATTWQSIGVLVFRGEVSIDLVDDLFSGPIVASWRKLQCDFFEERREKGRETVGE